jgi:hypothetical protein
MMRCFRVAVVLVILFIVCCSVSLGAVLFVHEKTLTVPGISNFGSALLSGQFPQDPRVLLIHDSAQAVVWSVDGDSALCRVLADTGYQVISAALADADADSVLDLAVAMRRQAIDTIGPPRAAGKIRVWSGNNHFLTSIADSIPEVYDDDFLLRAVSLAPDNLPQLLVSYPLVFSELLYYMWIHEVYYGATLIYSNFPADRDSLGFRIVDIGRYALPGGTSLTLARTSYGEYTEVNGPDAYNTNNQIGVLNADHSFTAYSSFTDPYYFGDCYVYGNHSSLSAGCVGLLASGAETDIVMDHSYYFSCSGPNTASDHSFRQFECWSLLNGVPTINRWVRDLTGTSYSQYAFNPLLPGYFFAFSGDTLLMFRGIDGSIRDRITNVPTGAKHWDYLYGDSIPRLVVVNGASVSIYHLDIATDVDTDPHRAQLPSRPLLEGPFPNPFNPVTMLYVFSEVGGPASLEVLNVTGQRVALLFDGTLAPHSSRGCEWNAVGHASGVYFARAVAPEGTMVKKMLLLK